MISAFDTLVGAVLVLGVMILVHEFGHFAAAKLLGVRVEVFSIGFGKRLLGFRRGDTDYRISALPLGGYVKMTGVNAVEMPEERPEGAPANDPGEFMKHPRWHRLLIAVAGPVANLMLAVGLLTVVFAVHHEVPYGLYQPAVVGWVMSGSAAEQAGVKEGDQILQIGNTQNPTWQDVENKVFIRPNQPLSLRVKRDDHVLPITVVPKADGRQQAGDAGWMPKQPFVVTALEPNMPGVQSGLKVGDKILSVDGKPIHTTGAMQAYLQTMKGAPVHLELLRDGKQLSLTVTPKLEMDAHKPYYRIGFISEPVQIEKLPLPEAFSRSVEECRKLSGLVFELIERMAERKISMRQMSGPIEIVRVSGELVHHRSANDMMEFMSMISLQLGFFNLLPIPILDGGLIAMLLVESVMRRDINEAIKIRLYQAAFVCLVLFTGIVIFNDVVKMLPGQ